MHAYASCDSPPSHTLLDLKFDPALKLSHKSFEEAKKLPEWHDMDKDMATGMIKIMGAIAATNAAKSK